MTPNCSVPGWADFLLDCEKPKKLVQYRWRIINPIIYLIYRMILAVYTIIVLVMGISFHPEFSLIYLTSWGYLILTLNFLIKAFVTSRYFHWLKIENPIENDENTFITPRSPDQEQGLPWLLQFSWLLTNIATPIGIIISIIFWCILVPQLPAGVINADSIQHHGINSLLLILDICIIASPIRMVHFYQPLAFGLTYIAFNAIYWAAGGFNPWGGRAIYPITDWSKPLKTGLVIIIALVLLIVIQFILVILTNCLDRLSVKIRRETDQEGIYENL